MLAFKTYEMLQAVVFGVLVLSGAVELWHLYVLSAALGTSMALFLGPTGSSAATFLDLVGDDA